MVLMQAEPSWRNMWHYIRERSLADEQQHDTAYFLSHTKTCQRALAQLLLTTPRSLHSDKLRQGTYCWLHRIPACICAANQSSNGRFACILRCSECCTSQPSAIMQSAPYETAGSYQEDWSVLHDPRSMQARAMAPGACTIPPGAQPGSRPCNCDQARLLPSGLSSHLAELTACKKSLLITDVLYA